MDGFYGVVPAETGACMRQGASVNAKGKKTPKKKRAVGMLREICSDVHNGILPAEPDGTCRDAGATPKQGQENAYTPSNFLLAGGGRNMHRAMHSHLSEACRDLQAANGALTKELSREKAEHSQVRRSVHAVLRCTMPRGAEPKSQPCDLHSKAARADWSGFRRLYRNGVATCTLSPPPHAH